MSPEQEVNPNRLEIHVRNALQAALIKRKRSGAMSSEEVLVWVEKYGDRISNIIDDPREVTIRDAAKAGDFEKAAELLDERLHESELGAA